MAVSPLDKYSHLFWYANIYLGDESSDQFYIVNLISFISLLLLGALVNIVRFYHDRYIWERVWN